MPPKARTFLPIVLCLFLLAACGMTQSTPEAYLPYYFVTVPANATPTPTPFQPSSAHVSDGLALPAQPRVEILPTLPPQLLTATPLPTATPPAQPPEFVTPPPTPA